MGCADAAAVEGRRDSNIYEVNPWLWQFGRGKARLGGLSVEATEERKQAHRDEGHQRAVETRRGRKADRAWFQMKYGGEQCIYYVYTVIY